MMEEVLDQVINGCDIETEDSDDDEVNIYGNNNNYQSFSDKEEYEENIASIVIGDDNSSWPHFKRLLDMIKNHLAQKRV